MRPSSPPSAAAAPLGRLVAVLTVLLVSLALLPAGAASAAPSPRNDYPRMPASCATAKEKIPQKPVVCKLNAFEKDRPTIVLWGDSHAWMMIPALKGAIRTKDVNLVAVVMGSCPPMDPALTSATRERASSCDRSNDLALRYVRGLKRGDEAVRVVLGGSWQRYVRALRVGDKKSYVGEQAHRMKTQLPRLMRALGQARIGTDVIGQVATVPAVLPRCSAGNDPYACDIPRRKALKDQAEVKRYLTRTMAPLAGTPALVDVNPSFCTTRVCRGKVERIRTFFDDLHLSATMSSYLRPHFARTVERVVPGQPTTPSQPCTVLGLPIC